MPYRATLPDLLPRGVYIERFTVRGQRWAYAVDRCGERILERPIFSPEDQDAVVSDLFAELDRVDPIQSGAVVPFPSHLRVV